MPVEYATFTPKTRTGKALWLDVWNADLFDGVSDLNRCHSDDVIQSRRSPKTWAENFQTDNPNGIIQAIFDVEEKAYYSVSAVLSSSGSFVNMYIDDDQAAFKYIYQDGQQIVAMAELNPEVHSVTIEHKPVWIFATNDLWFHGITIYKY